MRLNGPLLLNTYHFFPDMPRITSEQPLSDFNGFGQNDEPVHIHHSSGTDLNFMQPVYYKHLQPGNLSPNLGLMLMT